VLAVVDGFHGKLCFVYFFFAGFTQSGFVTEGAKL
jgi:hypothetical protein